MSSKMTENKNKLGKIPTREEQKTRDLIVDSINKYSKHYKGIASVYLTKKQLQLWKGFNNKQGTDWKIATAENGKQYTVKRIGER